MVAEAGRTQVRCLQGQNRISPTTEQTGRQFPTSMFLDHLWYTIAWLMKERAKVRSKDVWPMSQHESEILGSVARVAKNALGEASILIGQLLLAPQAGRSLGAAMGE